MNRHRSTAGPLAAAYLLLVIYASLYPFIGWRWPAGQSLSGLLALPWPPWRIPFDEGSNLLGYLPLGALLFAAVVRRGGSVTQAWLLALVLPATLSYGLELLQNFLPSRHPSLRDWSLNAGGAALGASIAWLMHVLGLYDRWQRVRERWFVPESGGAIALLLLWPVGLLFPTPVPLGQGQVFDALRSLADAILGDTPWAAWVGAGTALPARALAPAREALAIGLAMLGPCLLASAVTRPGWRRVVMAPGAAAVGLVTMTLSTALNFGPEHALTWLTPVTLPAIGAATGIAMLLAPAGPRTAAALGLVALSAMVTLVAEAPADPYYAASLQRWEAGRFIRFHGLAQWIGWLWPYAAMGWLVARLARRP